MIIKTDYKLEIQNPLMLNRGNKHTFSNLHQDFWVRNNIGPELIVRFNQKNEKLQNGSSIFIQTWNNGQT